MFEYEKKCTTWASSSSSSSSNSMNIIIGIIWRVKLNNPINVGEVKASLSNISAKKNSSLGLAEFKVSRSSLLLFLLAMNVLYWNINVVQKVTVEFDGIAAWHENHYLLLKILTEECEEKLEFDLWIFDDDVTLLKIVNSLILILLSNFNKNWVLQW